MRGLLVLGIGAFATGAAVAIVQQRRASVDEDYGEDPNWPSVPYTKETHPESPQEQVTALVQPAPAEGASTQPLASSDGDEASRASSTRA